MMEFRNAVLTDTGAIDCEINHPVHGWIPFTASPNDPEEHGRLIHAAALAMGPAPYVEPPPPDPAEALAAWREAAEADITDVLERALRAEILTAEEYLIASRGDVPARFEAALSAIQEPDRTVFRGRWMRGGRIRRADPGVEIIQAALDLPPEETDALFGWTAP